MAKPPVRLTSTLTVSVVFSPSPRVVHACTLPIAQGACVRDALLECALDTRFSQAVRVVCGKNAARLRLSIWGIKAALDDALPDLARIEISRPLRVDPTVARRERFAKQGARSAGLFAKRRPQGKAGY